jgi:hypothetical protein
VGIALITQAAKGGPLRRPAFHVSMPDTVLFKEAGIIIEHFTLEIVAYGGQSPPAAISSGSEVFHNAGGFPPVWMKRLSMP